MKYTGEGSMQDPKFPLKFVHSSGAITICNDRKELAECAEFEYKLTLYGLISALVVALILSPLLLWFII